MVGINLSVSALTLLVIFKLSKASFLVIVSKKALLELTFSAGAGVCSTVFLALQDNKANDEIRISI